MTATSERILGLALLLFIPNYVAGTAGGESRLDVGIERADAFDPSRPRVTLTYHYSGDGSVRFALPNDQELPSFRGLEVEVDGRLPPFVLALDHLEDPKHSVVVELEPGQTHEWVVDLSKIYLLPDTWDELQVQVRKTHHKMKGLGEVRIRAAEGSGSPDS